MRNTLTRIGAFIASLFAGAPPPRQNTRAKLRAGSPTFAEPVKHRYKTGGPNWLKIAINSQKHR